MNQRPNESHDPAPSGRSTPGVTLTPLANELESKEVPPYRPRPTGQEQATQGE